MALKTCCNIPAAPVEPCSFLHEPHILKRLEIHPDGTVIGRYTNGDSADLTGKIMYDPNVPIAHVKKI